MFQLLDLCSQNWHSKFTRICKYLNVMSFQDRWSYIVSFHYFLKLQSFVITNFTLAEHMPFKYISYAEDVRDIAYFTVWLWTFTNSLSHCFGRSCLGNISAFCSKMTHCGNSSNKNISRGHIFILVQSCWAPATALVEILLVVLATRCPPFTETDVFMLNFEMDAFLSSYP